MKAFLKVLALVVIAVVVSGCATYHSALRTIDSGFRDIVRDNNMRVYVEHVELEHCAFAGLLGIIRGREDRCVKINTSMVLVPALKSEGIKVVDNTGNANVIVKLTHLSIGRGRDYAPTIAKFDINNNVVKIIAKSYRGGIEGALLTDKRDWDAGVKTVEMVITKLLKHNKTCNDCTIVAKTTHSKEDGKKILSYRDNTGF